MKKIFFILLPVIIFAGLVFLQSKTNKTSGETNPAENKIVNIETQKASESKSLTKSTQYPATVSADQQATITAMSSGIITAVNFDLGKYVRSGSTLAHIDDAGSHLSPGENNLRSLQVQQLELSIEQAKESLKLAKKNKKEENTPTTKANKNIAEIQLKTSEIALSSALDSRTVLAPISGKVVSRAVSVGDSVSIGQTIATISKTGKMKVSFYVEQDRVSSFSVGQKISLILSDGSHGNAIVTNIAPEADQATKRFQIDVLPEKETGLYAGTILTAVVEYTENVSENGNLIIPLSAIAITQNENYIFVVDNDLAKKISVEVVRIFGEYAEIKADIPTDTQIVVEGNKLLKDGSKVEVRQ